MDKSARESLLREEFHSQTARIEWRELQTYYAHGSVIRVDKTVSLIDVAVQLAMDNADQFQRWITSGEVAAVADEEALQWHNDKQLLWTVVAAPWVLVQVDLNQPTAEG